MTNFSPAQVNTITFLTMGVFNNDRHHDVMESMGCGQDGLAETLQPYGAVLADLEEDYAGGVYLYEVCEEFAAELFINLYLDSGLPDISHWKEHIIGMTNEVANVSAMKP
jgi:hypothetical protein